MPGPSYDLWEETYGVSTYTTASVYGGLTSAAHLASLLGKKEDADLYCEAADKMKDAMLEYLYDEETGCFVKTALKKDSGFEYDKTVDASSFFGVFRFNVLPIDDGRLERFFDVIEKHLSSPIPVGGTARYNGDEYFTVDHDLPGNPWFITTLWCIQYKVMKAKNEKDMKEISADLDWVTQHALESGVLSEQLDPHTGRQVSIAPLSWSHAEYVRSVIDYMRKLERLGIHPAQGPLK